jgi:flagellar basal-body rod modification protein FlgD
MSVIDSNTLASLGLTSTDTTANNKSDRLGQTDFLRLMITQLENQDPFKPMESGEFLGQLAQFGTVSGIEDLQRSFQQFSQTIYSGQTLQAAGLVDRQVMVPGNMSLMDPAHGQRGAVQVPVSASEVTVAVYNQAGQLVRRIPMGPQEAGMREFVWDGRDESGAVLAPGIYEFQAEARIGGRSEALATYLSGRVESVSVGNYDGSLTLRVEGLGEFDFSSVRQIG